MTLAERRYHAGREGHRSILSDVFGFEPLSFAPTQNVDITRTENGYSIEIPVPGFKPGEIKATFEDSVLSIQGQNERRKVMQAFRLPETVDPDAIKLHVEHGLLIVTLALQPNRNPKPLKCTTAKCP